MICPKDMVQMVQFEEAGGGYSTEKEYSTWEIKVCKICGLKMFEGYQCRQMTDEEVTELLSKQQIED